MVAARAGLENNPDAGPRSETTIIESSPGTYGGLLPILLEAV